jgi:hypothetical protein
MLKALLLISFTSFLALNNVSAQKDSIPPYSLKIGGALRMNYNVSSWKPDQVARGGDFGYDLFRINVQAEYNRVFLNVEYRLYSTAFGGGMLKQGWVGYRFKNEKSRIELGLTQVPFGIQQYNSNNWFFNITYYTGLEDDHDMGIKFVHEAERITYHLAFFKNAEELKFSNSASISPNRYSYDVAGRNKEVNQFNAKVDFKLGEKKNHVLSVFGQYGGLYNVVVKELGNHYGFGAAFETRLNKLRFKFQAVHYTNNPNDTVQDLRIIEMAAYGALYNVASQGNVFTAGIAYDIDVKWGPISRITLYNDFGLINKSVESFSNSYMNVAGGMVTAGKVYTFIDFAFGKNHSWLGPDWSDAFGAGNVNAEWNLRFNVNIGYYF